MTWTTRTRAAGKLALIATTAALALGVQAVRAADATAVSEVVVTGGLEETVPLELAKYGNRVDVVTGRQIELSGFPDVAQVLSRSVPGLYVAPQSGPFSYVFASLQGSRPN